MNSIENIIDCLFDPDLDTTVFVHFNQLVFEVRDGKSYKVGRVTLNYTQTLQVLQIIQSTHLFPKPE